METLCKWVADSACESGWRKQMATQDQVPSHWCDCNNVHIFLYIDQGPGEFVKFSNELTLIILSKKESQPKVTQKSVEVKKHDQKSRKVRI